MKQELEKHMKNMDDKLSEMGLDKKEKKLVKMGYKTGFKVGFVAGKYSEKMDAIYNEWLKGEEKE